MYVDYLRNYALSYSLLSGATVRRKLQVASHQQAEKHEQAQSFAIT